MSFINTLSSSIVIVFLFPHIWVYICVCIDICWPYSVITLLIPCLMIMARYPGSMRISVTQFLAFITWKV